MIRSRQRERFADALELQGPGFVELRTPPNALSLDERGLHVLPPAEVFGQDRHPRTQEVLDGRRRAPSGFNIPLDFNPFGDANYPVLRP